MEAKKKISQSKKEENSNKTDQNTDAPVKKGPLSFLSGALSSLFFSWLCFLLSRKVVLYFTMHSSNYTSPIAQSIASAMKTLAIGICFLATFTFAFIGLGLTIVFIRSLFNVNTFEED